MKKLLFLLLAFILSLLLTIVALAHSGKTDSRGGHYDRSSGEYHYHHGYSAHDHYDMDGDGVKDCPYEFKDKTNSSGSENKTDTIKNNGSKTNESSTRDILDFVFTIIVSSLFILLAFGIYIYYLIGALIESVFKREGAAVERASLIITIVTAVVISAIIAAVAS